MAAIRRTQSNEHVTIDNMRNKTQLILDQYDDDVADAVRVVVQQLGDETAERTRQASAAAFPAGKKWSTGAYAKGWRSELTEGRNFETATVHNKTRYRLAHLLENGHVVAGGTKRSNAKTFVAGKPHIADVEKWANEELEKRLAEVLGDGNG